jgi:hypothetical protein
MAVRASCTAKGGQRRPSVRAQQMLLGGRAQGGLARLPRCRRHASRVRREAAGSASALRTHSTVSSPARHLLTCGRKGDKTKCLAVAPRRVHSKWALSHLSGPLWSGARFWSCAARHRRQQRPGRALPGLRLLWRRPRQRLCGREHARQRHPGATHGAGSDHALPVAGAESQPCGASPLMDIRETCFIMQQNTRIGLCDSSCTLKKFLGPCNWRTRVRAECTFAALARRAAAASALLVSRC